MDIAQVEARPRQERGSRPCRRLRKQGLVPAVICGHGQPNVLLTVRRASLEDLLAERAMIVQVNWDGEQESAQIKEVQYDALGDDIVHVDFVRISLTEAVTVSVPVEPHGDAVGVEQGGMLDLRQHELEVECLPTAIPEKLRVEIAELDIGDILRVSDVEFPEGVRPTAHPETVVLTIVRPAEVVEEEPEVPPEEIAAEPELIGREAAEAGPEEGAEGAPPAEKGR